MTHPTVQVQPNTQVTDIPLTERQRPKGDHFFLRFFILPLWIGPSDRGPPFQVVIQPTMYLPVPGIEPTSPVFLGESVTHKATVADICHLGSCHIIALKAIFICIYH